MRIVDMTRIDSMIVFNPNKDIIEDRRRKVGYTLKEISTVLTRMKLIIFCWEYLKDCDRPVIYYDYPRYSIAWYIVRIFHSNKLTIVLGTLYILL
jgi:hypothetical protein